MVISHGNSAQILQSPLTPYALVFKWKAKMENVIPWGACL